MKTVTKTRALGVSRLYEQDEPTFILRGKDPASIAALLAYSEYCVERSCDLKKLKGLGQAISTFIEYALQHPELMRAA